MRELEFRRKENRVDFPHTTASQETVDGFREWSEKEGLPIGRILDAVWDYHKSMREVKKGNEQGRKAKGS